jgi:hypothetical protein
MSMEGEIQQELAAPRSQKKLARSRNRIFAVGRFRISVRGDYEKNSRVTVWHTYHYR